MKLFLRERCDLGLSENKESLVENMVTFWVACYLKKDTHSTLSCDCACGSRLPFPKYILCPHVLPQSDMFGQDVYVCFFTLKEKVVVR